MSIEPRDLTSSPPTMAFSKIRNVARLPDEQISEFLNGLYRVAVEAKDAGDWTRVEVFLQQWENRLTSRSAANALRFDTSPWTPLRRALREARVALVSTGGIYIKGQQEPYNTDGDASFRVIPKNTPRELLGVAHTHYDTSGALKDINVVFPYQRLREMEQEGLIGSFAEPCYGFMGYIPSPLVPSLLEESAPEVAERLVADDVDAVLIGTT